MIKDTYRHKGLRKQLIDVLRVKGISDEMVLNAMMAIPRHLFMDEAFLQFAYEDQAFPIGSGQTISQPYTVAFQSSLLQAKPGDKVLEIGTGSAYQTCVLEKMGLKVFSIERQIALYRISKERLHFFNYKARVFHGDGYKGLPAFAPFDKVLITAGAPFVPEDLKTQLKIGGIMVIPVNDGDSQIMTRITKLGENDFDIKQFGRFAFVPLLKSKEWKA